MENMKEVLRDMEEIMKKPNIQISQFPCAEIMEKMQKKKS